MSKGWKRVLVAGLILGSGVVGYNLPDDRDVPPGASLVYDDGTVVLSDGGTVYPDGTVVLGLGE